jgi:hypothetical protein
MFTLLYIGILIVVLAGIVTVQAAMTAPEGYEDQSGFHVVSAHRDGVADDALADRELKVADRKIPRLVVTR